MIDASTLVNSNQPERGLAYSATVRMELYLDGPGIFSPTHAAYNQLIFSEPQTILPLTNGRLAIWIDDVPMYSAVQILPHESPAEVIPIITIGPLTGAEFEAGTLPPR